MTRNFTSPLLFASFVLIVLAALLAPNSATAREPGIQPPDEQAAAAPVGTTFTYQGELTDNGSPANGAYDFQFLLYDALGGGSQVGATVTVADLSVSEGLFTAALDFGSVFDGTALWLEIGVREGASTGAYTALTPRQPLTGAPYALSLRPGAWITGSDTFGILRLANNTGEGLRITSTGEDGIRVDAAVDDGLHVVGAGSDGVHVELVDANGIRVDSAATGLYILSAAQDGIHIDNTGLEGVDISNATNDGFEVDNTGQDGLHVGTAGSDGVHVENAVNSGVQIDHTDGDGIFICAVGTETTCTPTIVPLNNGVEIGNAEDVGVYVGWAGASGLFVSYSEGSAVGVQAVAGDGMFVGSAGNDGMHVNGAGNNGVDVTGDNLAGYFSGNIQVTGSCTGCLLATFGVNSGGETLQPGDLVTVQGVQTSGVDSVLILLEVTPAKAGQTVVGVVGGWAELIKEETPRPTEIGLRLIPREGPAAPGAYVTIIYSGPVQVQAGSLDGGLAAGTRLTLAADGGVRALQTTTVNGIQVAESAPVVGIALSKPDAAGLVWVLVNPQ